MAKLTNGSRVVTFRITEADFLSTLDKIVATKQDMGIQTTFSYEIIRLAKNGLNQELIGAEIDRAILLENPNKVTGN